MEFICGEIEPDFTRCSLPSFCLAFIFALGCLPLLSISLLWQLLGVKAITKLPSKVTKGSPKGFCQGIKGGKCVISVESEFGIDMPG